MKTAYITLMAALAITVLPSCSEIDDGTSDIDSWAPLHETFEPKVYTFNHPCILHTRSDIEYVKAHLGQSPWAEAYARLGTSGYCNTSYQPTPVKYLARLNATNWAAGGGRWVDAGLEDEYYDGIQNNYTHFFRDAHAAYQLGLKWQLEGNSDAAATAVKIINAWASVNQGLLLGRKKWKDDVIDSNEYLIMFQIHQIACAAELVRDYNGYGSSADFRKVVDWLTTYFYPFCHKFIETNNQAKHWWMNWDLASMTAMLSIGILADNNDMVNEAILYFKQGKGPGGILNLGVVDTFEDPSGSGEILAQGNESGRDQGHNTLCAIMLGYFCQMANSIGEDLFAFHDGLAVSFAEYVAKYNLVKPEFKGLKNMSDDKYVYSESTMPFTAYAYCGLSMTKISADGRGEERPGWDLWAGYCASHGIKGKYVSEWAAQYRPDGGGGHYGPNSGGFDQLGFSTLMYYRPSGE